MNNQQIAQKLGVNRSLISQARNYGRFPKNKAINQKIKQFFKQHKITINKPFEEEKPMLTTSAKKHFKLSHDPFINDITCANDVFLWDDARYIRQALFHTAKHGGFLAIVGESGSGKTTLRRDLVERIRLEEQPITLIHPQSIDKTRLSASAISDAIIEDISNEHPKRTLEAKARQITKLLKGSSLAGNSHCLIIEEAHDLNVQTLKYLKRFWELEDGFKKLLSIILIGQLELKTKLDIQQNWEAREVIRRIELAELQPLGASLKDYLFAKFNKMGIELPRLFESSSFLAMEDKLSFKNGRGSSDMTYPLLVNNLTIKALNTAAQIGAPKVDEQIIQSI